MTKNALLITAAASLLSNLTFAYAQEAEKPEVRVFDTITVTAQKVEENSQDVPISIATFSGDALNEIGVSGSDDLGNLVPGLELGRTNGEGSQLIIFLRGSGLNDFNSNNAGPVALYSDEVYISSPVLTPFQFFDVDRVEVLKGPQGTLYGRNTTGGAIKTVTNKPTDEFEFSARAMVGEFETTEFEAAISGPITEKLAARVAIQHSYSDGFTENALDGTKTNGHDILSWRGIADYQATDNFLIRANIHGASNQSEAAAPNFLGIFSGGTDALGYAGTGDPFVGEYEPIDDNDLDAIGGYLEMEWDLGGVTITSISAYDEVDNFNVDHTDAGPNQLLDVKVGTESETFTQELRMVGSTDRFNWLAGLYYLTEDLDQDSATDVARTVRNLPVSFGGTGGLPDPTGALTGGLPVALIRTINTQETDTLAIFGQVDYFISDKWTLTLGGRYTDEDRSFDGAGFFDEPALAPVLVPIYAANDLSADDGAFSWKFGVDYQPVDNVLLYSSASRGFKSGGFDGSTVAFQLDPIAALQPYDPEFVNAYEIGVKSELFDDMLRVNGAVFFNDISDLQVFTLINSGSLPVTQLTNAADAEVFGVELDVTAYPIDGLLINLSTSYLDSELQNFVSGSGEDLSGNQIAFTPEVSVSGLVRYDHDLGNYGSVYAQTSFSYKDDQFFTTENDPLAGQEAYTVVNARFGYTTPDGRYGFAVFGRNITDKAYLTNAFDLTDFGWYQRFFAPPAMWGAELTVDF